MQCPFISHAASLSVESEPFWTGLVVEKGIMGWLSVLAGTLDLGCPQLMVAPHPPCLTDPCSSWFHQSGLAVVSLPAAASWLPAAVVPSSPMPGTPEERHMLPSVLGTGEWELQRWGKNIEGMEILVLALDADTALGIPCCHAASASLVPVKWAMALLPLVQGGQP